MASVYKENFSLFSLYTIFARLKNDFFKPKITVLNSWFKFVRFDIVSSNAAASFALVQKCSQTLYSISFSVWISFNCFCNSSIDGITTNFISPIIDFTISSSWNIWEKSNVCPLYSNNSSYPIRPSKKLYAILLEEHFTPSNVL